MPGHPDRAEFNLRPSTWDGYRRLIELHAAVEQASEAERPVAIGAQRVEWDSYPDDPDFVVLADPDSNRFWIVDLSHGHD